MRNGNDDISSGELFEESRKTWIDSFFARTVNFCPIIFVLSRDPIPLKWLFPMRPLWAKPRRKGTCAWNAFKEYLISSYLIYSAYGSIRIITILNWWNVWKHPHGLPNCEVHNVNIRDWGHIRDENIVWRQHGLYNVMHPSQQRKQQHMQKLFGSFTRVEKLTFQNDIAKGLNYCFSCTCLCTVYSSLILTVKM